MARRLRLAFFDHVLPIAPELHERLTAGIDVLDAGCGRGAALLAMARRYPASRFVGYDLCADAIDFAAQRARTEELTNVRFETRDLTGYAEPGRWDLVASFDAVHDQKDPLGLVAGIHASLRPGGVYLMQDIGASADLEKNRDFSLRHAALCRVDRSLHARVHRPGRRGARHDVGMGDRRAVPAPGGLCRSRAPCAAA
ncbi:class I SAM-dependent methyltransferase [Jhaorihella thermophila]